MRDSPVIGSSKGSGTLLLVDISGYTAFLRGVGEAHAEELATGTFIPEAYPLLTSLLQGIVETIAPTFELSDIEGDAVFAFAGDGDLTLRGAPLLACLAQCYETYRARSSRRLRPSIWRCRWTTRWLSTRPTSTTRSFVGTS